MASFAEWTEQQKKKKKKEELTAAEQSAAGKSFTEYTKQVTGRDDIDAPLSERKKDDDIAPVVTTTEKEDDRKWFQKGLFEDGYQFGDITKTILGTGTDVSKNATTGVVGMGEKLLDAGMTLGALMNRSTMNQAAENEMIFNAVTGKDATGVLGRYQKAQGEVEKETAEFVAKDLYDEEKVAQKIIAPSLSYQAIKALGAEDEESFSVLGEKSDALAQSAGQLGATAALQAVGVPWWLTTGATTFGSEAENAFNEGATFDEAVFSSAVSAGAEILTEKISGGISFGGGTLDDVLTKELGRVIANKTARTLVKLGVDAAGEGFEEILSGALSAVGQKMSYAKEKDFNELFSSEEAFESFVGGAVLGGGSSVVNAVKAKANGVDAVTEFTDNEQKVVDKVYQDRVAEAEENGKITESEKRKIYNAVLNDFEKGYISTDTIEEVLGGDTYKTYKDTIDDEDAQVKELEAQIKELEAAQNTVGNAKKYDALTAQLEELKTNSQRDQLKQQLGDEVFNLTKDSRLVESYNERARRGMAYEADLTKYDAKQQAIIQKAIDSGILNNTNRTHEFVDMVAKISADKGVLFDFTDNAKLKESGFAINGAQVNGYVTKDGVTVNIDSAKSLNSVVGHEITHILEGTELYTELQSVLFEYAKSKKDYQSRYDTLAALYKDVEDADIDAELTADLVGDYLFTDSDFISRLSTEHRNVFQKIYDEVKYLLKVATAGSKEARELEKVKRAFDKAYKESGKAVGGTKMSMSTEGMTEADQENANKVIGNLKIYAGSSKYLDGYATYTTERMEREIRASSASGRPDYAKSYITWVNPIDFVYATTTSEQFRNQLKEEAGKLDIEKLKSETQPIHLTVNFETGEIVGHEGRHRMLALSEAGVDKVAIVIDALNDNRYNTKPIEFMHLKGQKFGSYINGTDFFLHNVLPLSERYADTARELFTNKPKSGIQYSLTDSNGKQLSKEQGDYFKDSKVRNENGNLKVMYHGTSNGGHTVFDTYGSNYGLFGQGSYFTDNKDIAQSYTNKGKGNNKQVYESYLNITNPIDMDAQANPEEWAKQFPDVDFPANGTNEAFYRAAEEYYADQMLPKYEVAEYLMEDLMGMGYDGITHIGGGRVNADGTKHQVYVAFHPEQIKNIDNAKPTNNADIRYSLSSMGSTFFGNESMSIAEFTAEDYKRTTGYQNYVNECLNNYKQTRGAMYDEAVARKEIEDGIDGIVRVAIAAKKAGYDIFDDGVRRSKTDSKKRLLFSSLEPNSDYFTSSDISTICDKRQNFADIYDDIVRAEEAKGVPQGKRFFDNIDNYFYLHGILAEKGLTQPCRQCYVESMRKNLAPMASAFLRLVNETDANNTANDQLYQQKGKNKGALKTNNAALRERVLDILAESEMSASDLTVEMLTTEDGLAQLKITAPLVYEAFNSFYGQSKPKMPKSATPFRFGELTALLTDEKGKIKQSLVDKINATGGFRLQSYSDFQIQNYTDVLQVIFEAGTLGLSGHAYTKVPAFLEATDGTNLKRNISIFMYKDGNEWKLDRNDSFPYTLEEIYDIVNADKSGNTGIIAVSQNEDMSAWIMANDYIAYGIPFHKSGLKMGTVRDTIVKDGEREIKGYTGTKDHTRQQTEVWAKTTDDHKALTKVKNGINIYDFWDFDNKANLSKNELIEKNVKAYIDACEKAGYLPKFREYVIDNGKVLNNTLAYAKELGFVPQDATIEDISFKYKGYTIPYGYYKFLGDFGMFAPDGKASPHEALSLKDYDFDKAVKFFEDSETLRRNEILQQFANDGERQKYAESDLTAADLLELVKQKRVAVVDEVMSRYDAPMSASLSKQGEAAPTYGNYNVRGEDVKLETEQDEVAPVQEDVAPVQDTAPVTAPKDEANELISAIMDEEFRLQGYDKNAEPDYAPTTAEEANEQANRNLRRITDADAPPEAEAPYQGDHPAVTADDPFSSRNWHERGTKAFITDNPDAKPFFQEAAQRLADDYAYTMPAERGFNGDAYYESGGEKGFYGWSRQAADDINTLIDVYGLSYAQIEEGLDAIINDTAKVNNKPAKAIEFILNDRMLKGYETYYSHEYVAPNQGYIEWLNGQRQAEEYSEIASTITDADAPIVDDVAPVAETAPVADSLTVEDVMPIAEHIAPVAEKYEAIKPKPKKEPRMVRADNAEQPRMVRADNSKANEKQRKWVGTSTESEAVNREILPDDLDPKAIHYQPIPNKVTLGKANARLDGMGYDKAVNYFNSQLANKNTPSLEDIALGERLLQEAIKKGDTKTAGELIQDIAILGTELGQKVQALSIIKRLTPEGQLKMLQKVVERGKTKGDKAYEGVELTQDMIDKILKVYNKDGSFDHAKLNKAVEDVKQDIANKMKVTKLDKVNAWRYLSMLGNPKTHIRNLVSNVAMRGTVAVKNVIARTVEDIAPIENRTKTWKRATDEVRAFAEKTTAEMQDILRDGGKYSEDASIKEKRKIFKSKILNGLYEFNSDMLSREDWWFSKPAFTHAFAECLTANGIRTEEDILLNPEIVEKARQYATEQSQIATFRQYSWLSNKINEIERKNAATSIAVGAVLPFKKTPINIAKTGLNYSPLGFAKTLTYDIAQVKNGKMEASELADHLAQNLTGTGLALVGFMLAQSGFLSGGGEDDKEGEYDYQLGEQAYAVNIGGKSYSLSWLSPVAMPLFVGANAYEQLVEGKEWNGDVVVETLAQTLDPLSEMSFVSGLDSVLSSYDSGIEKFAGIGQSMAQNYITQFVPTLSSQVATVLDDTKRSTKVAGDSGFKFVDETINKLKLKIPVLRETLEPSTDIWGNEVKQTEDMLTRSFETFLAPYAKKESIATSVDEEIKSLYSETGDDGLIPSIPYNYVNYKDEKYKMSAEEYTAYKKTYGQTAFDMLEDLYDTSTYRNATAEEKADMVNRVYDYARDAAKREYLAKEGVNYTNTTEDKVEVFKENPIKGAIENDMSVDEYSFYRDNPEKYAVAKAVGGYTAYKGYSSELYDIKADKDEDGKSISGSRKEKVIEYINNLDADYGERIILFKSEYNADDTYNYDIIEYLNGRDDISYEEMETILKELGFTVTADGSIYW